MSLYPAAEQRIWKPYDPERFIQPRAVILHTNAVNAEDPGPTGGLSWHFQVGEHGHVYQHRDTGTRAAANANANDFAISIETWDGGDPEGNPWNPEQLDALVALIGWCCDNHAIPRRKIATWDGYGIGYHRLFTEWDIPYHSCPGNTRAAQFDDVILPRLIAAPTQGADDMPLNDADKAFITQTVIDQVRKAIEDQGAKGAADPRINGADKILAAVAEVKQQVAQPAGSTTLHGDVPLSGTLHFG